MKLSDIAYFVSEKVSSIDISVADYITTDCLLPNKEGRTVAANLPPKKCTLTQYRKGDVLVANIRPYLKKVWLADSEGGASADVLVFRAREGFTSSYLFAVLLQDSFYEWTMASNRGTQMPRGDKNHIMQFDVPDLGNTHIFVGDFIVNMSHKIALNRQINQNLEALARQLYDYWFVQFDFPDANGKPYKSSGGKMVYNPILKREIPEGWENIKLAELVRLEDSKRIPLSTYERENRKGIYPYYGATGIMDYIDDYLFDDEIILLAEDGSTSDEHGFPIVQYVWGKVWVNNHAHIIYPRNLNHKIYTYFLLKQIPAKLIETGSIQKKINQDNLLKYNSIKVPTNILDDFTKIVSPLWRKKMITTEEILSLTKQRDELLPLLMNGQVTVE